MDSQNIVYMAYDGDNAGRLCGRAILADNPDALHEVSDRINLGHEIVKRWVEAHGGQFISGGGDEGVFSIPADSIANVEELRSDYQFATNLTATVGIGSTLSEAGKAMLVGKFRGKNQTVQYDPSIENEIKQAQGRMTSGTASAEEKKISEAYLQEGTGPLMATEDTNDQNAMSVQPGDANGEPGQDHDCQYCQAQSTEQVDDPDHCKYCHNDEALHDDCQYCNDGGSTADPQVGHDCPYCQESGALDDGCQYCQGTGSHDASAAGHDADCQYCNAPSANAPMDPSGSGGEISPTDGPTVQNPTTTDSENYAGQDLNNPDLPKPEAIQHNPDGLGTSFDSPTNENVKLDAQGQGGNNETNDATVQGGDPQAQQTVEEIVQQIDALPPDAQASPQNPIQVEPADTAIGTSMEDGVSRPDDYADPNTPQDMGLAEENSESPDVTSLMQEGLDSHASDIQKERVINLVSEALVGFKASKGILEKAKLQAPQLYEANIAMLKAMIEMCKILGLDQGGEQDVNEIESGANQDGIDQPVEGSAPPASAHTGEGQNPPKNFPEYAQKEDGAVGKPKGQSANQ